MEAILTSVFFHSIFYSPTDEKSLTKNLLKMTDTEIILNGAPAQTLQESKVTEMFNQSQPPSTEPIVMPKTAKRSVHRDSGIANTAANVQTLAETVDLFEPEYNAPNPLFSVAHLVIVYTQAMMYIAKVAAKFNLNKIAIDNRHFWFDDLKKFATRFINALIASGASQDTIGNAREFVNNLDGKRVIKISPDEEDKNHISVSKQSYVQQVQHFQGLIIIAKDEALWDPPAADLQILAMETRLQAMIDSNKEVSKAQAALDVARMQRNAFWDDKVTGLVDVCLGVKSNVKAIFGARSAQYKMIGKLAFRRIEGKK